MDKLNKKGIKKPRYFVQSLEKGLKLLQVFCREARPLTLSEIAEKMDTNLALATRFCHTLTHLGYLHKGKQKRYRLTPQILTLGYPSICMLGWHDVARFYLNSLFDEINETVSLSVLDETEIMYVLRITKKKYLPFDIRVGSKLPVYCTAMGKVLMAFGPPSAIQSILKKLKIRPITAHTISSVDKFLDELKDVRLKGYARNKEELSIGNLVVAAPILDKEGNAVAAISVAVQTHDYSIREVEKKLVPRLVLTAKQITEALQKAELTVVHGDNQN